MNPTCRFARIARLPVLLVLCAVSSVAIAHPPSVRHVRGYYEITDLGTLGGPVAVAWDINLFGQVSGSASLAEGGPGRAFRYTRGFMRDLGTLGGNNSQGLGINDRGDVVGDAEIVPFANVAFVFSNGQMQALPMDIAHDINNAGQIVGHLTEPFPGPGQSPIVAVMYDHGSLTRLGHLGGLLSTALAINEQGAVVGYSTREQFDVARAFVYRDGEMMDIGTLGGMESIANAINERGHITGVADLPGEPVAKHAFLYRDGQMRDLGTLGPATTDSIGWGMNNWDEVVGTSNERAFLYRHGRIQDLNNLIVPWSPFLPYVTLSSARAINDLGWIAAIGRDKRLGPDDRAYLLRPIRSHHGNSGRW